MRYARVVPATILAALALVPTLGRSTARAQPPAPVRATLFTSTVQWSTAPDTTVRVVLRNAQRVKGQATVTADAGGEVTATFPQGGGGGDNTIRADDLIGIHPSNGEAFTRTVPAMSVALDAATRTVSGQAPANAKLSVSARGPDDAPLYEDMVDVAADGRYAFGLPAGVQLEPGTYGTVTLAMLGGDPFAVRWDVLAAQVTIGSSGVTGRGTLGTTVRGQLESSGAVKGTTGQNPTTILRTPTFSMNFRQGTSTTPVAAGDTVILEHQGTRALEGVVPAITVSLDPAADRVTGTAPPDSAVVLTITPQGGTPVTVNATTDGAGAFVADVAGAVDVRPGTTAYAAYTKDFVAFRGLGVVSQVRAALYSAQVAGTAPQAATVSATLRDGGGAAIASGTGTAGSNGTFQFNLAESGGAATVRTAPGNRLEVTIGAAAPVEIVLPDLTAEANAATDTVSGVALPDAPVTVSLSGGGGGAPVVETRADGSGNYAASLAGVGDIVPGSTGTLVVGVGGGHTVSMAWALPRVAITLASNAVTGVGPSGRTVTALLYRGGSQVGRGTTVVGTGGGGPGMGSGWSVALRGGDGTGDPAPVQPGDRLTVAVATWSLDLVVPNVTVEADAGADRVSGAAPANREVRVTVSRGARTEAVTVTSSGGDRYDADFSGRWDISPGDTITSLVTLADGHTVTAEGGAPGLTIFLRTGVVSGTAARGVTVRATLRSSSGQVRGSGETQASGSGRFQLTLVDGSGQAVAASAGDGLRLEFGTSAIDMTIPMFTVDVDAGADTVSGEATPGGNVSIHAVQAVGIAGSDRTATAAPGPGGAYSVSFAGQVDIRAGTLLEASYLTVDGHVARIDERLPMANIQLGGNLLSGYAAPNASVVATLRRGASTLATTSGAANAAGAFSLRTMTGALQPVKIEVGDSVGIRWPGTALVFQVGGAGEIAAVTAELSGTIDAASRTVSGTTTPNAAVYMTMALGGAGQFTQVVNADAEGRFTQVIGGGAQPLNADVTVDAGVLDAAGHRTYVSLVVPYLELVMGTDRASGRASPLTDLALRLMDGATVVGRSDLTNSAVGDFATNLARVGAVAALIQAGRELTLTEPRSGTTSIEIPVLTIELDTAAHVIRGTAPPNSNVPVRIYPPNQDPVDRQARANASGAWSFDDSDLPRGATYTIADLTRADARLVVGNGHRVIAIAVPPGQPTPGPGSPTPVPGSPTPGPGSPTPTRPPTVTPITTGERIYLPYNAKNWR